MRLIAAALLIATLLGGNASAAELHVFSGGAPQQALRQLGPEFEKLTGHRVQFTFRIVGEIQQKLAAGERADVILLPLPLIAATGKDVPLRSEGRIVVARVGIGVIVPRGAKPPDLSTVEAVRTMLLGAQAIAWPEPSTPSGAHLNRAIEQLGVSGNLRPKLIVKAAIHGGADLVARREADVGLYLVSEVQNAPGVTLVGLLPGSFQSFVVYGTAVPTSNAMPEPALAFVKFISDPARREVWKASGFEPIAKPQP